MANIERPLNNQLRLNLCEQALGTDPRAVIQVGRDVFCVLAYPDGRVGSGIVGELVTDKKVEIKFEVTRDGRMTCPDGAAALIDKVIQGLKTGNKLPATAAARAVDLLHTADQVFAAIDAGIMPLDPRTALESIFPGCSERVREAFCEKIEEATLTAEQELDLIQQIKSIEIAAHEGDEIEHTIGNFEVGTRIHTTHSQENNPRLNLSLYVWQNSKSGSLPVFLKQKLCLLDTQTQEIIPASEHLNFKFQGLKSGYKYVFDLVAK